jgi:hypothetical protein
MLCHSRARLGSCSTRDMARYSQGVPRGVAFSQQQSCGIHWPWPAHGCHVSVTVAARATTTPASNNGLSHNLHNRHPPKQTVAAEGPKRSPEYVQMITHP